MTISMAGLLRAQESMETLHAARNGSTQKRARKRERRPLRLPEEVWDGVQEVTTELQLAFPLRYVSMNAVLEFLIGAGIETITEEKP